MKKNIPLMTLLFCSLFFTSLFSQADLKYDVSKYLQLKIEWLESAEDNNVSQFLNDAEQMNTLYEQFAKDAGFRSMKEAEEALIELSDDSDIKNLLGTYYHALEEVNPIKIMQDTYDKNKSFLEEISTIVYKNTGISEMHIVFQIIILIAVLALVFMVVKFILKILFRKKKK